MTPLLLERPPALERDLERHVHRRLDGARLSGQPGVHGRLTLDDLITDVWEGLAVRTVACPVCAGPMTRNAPCDQGDGAGGTCLDCGSCLS